MFAVTELKSPVVSDAIRGDTDLSRLVDRASDVLADVLREASALVDVYWDAGRQDGRRFLELTLQDAAGRASTRLDPGVFDDDRLLSLRLASLWTTMLQAQSEARLREMQAAIRRLDEPPA